MMGQRSSRGGMRTISLQYSIYCPVCGKPAYKREKHEEFEIYYHFGKNNSVQHKVRKEGTEVKE